MSKELTVDNYCPKDCRYRDMLGSTQHYCNYGEVAHAEGLIDKPIRGGTVADCKVYEKGKRRRKALQTPKSKNAILLEQERKKERKNGNRSRKIHGQI